MAQTVKYQPSHVVPTSQACWRVRSRRGEWALRSLLGVLERFGAGEELRGAGLQRVVVVLDLLLCDASGSLDGWMFLTSSPPSDARSRTDLRRRGVISPLATAGAPPACPLVMASEAPALAGRDGRPCCGATV